MVHAILILRIIIQLGTHQEAQHHIRGGGCLIAVRIIGQVDNNHGMISSDNDNAIFRDRHGQRPCRARTNLRCSHQGVSANAFQRHGLQ